MYSAKELAIARLIKPDIEVTQLDVTDLAVLQLVRKATGGGSGVYSATIENGIATFGGVTVSKPLVSLLLNIPVTQTGSGTPSPTNIRDFVGVTGAVIGQTSNYGEYFRGLLNGTYGFVDLGELTWSLQNTNETCNRWRASSDILIASRGYNNINNFTDDGWFQGVSVTSTTTTTNRIDTREGIIYLNIEKTVFDGDATEFNTWAQGKYIIYELAEPSTPITPQDFATLCQAFGITGNTYTISFGQTVYSANLDVLNGKLSITHEIKTIDENSDISLSTTGTGIFYLDDFFEIDEDTESINCNVYQRAENRSSVTGVINNNPDYSFCCKLGTNPTRIFIKETRFTSVDDYKTWLSTNPVKIAVKLATPIEIDITPTVINTLIGENVIFADVADVTECKFTRK